MKQLVFSKTLIFLFVMVFVIAFQSVFGMDNTLVGVTIVVALLMFLERDLTVSPWKNFFFLLGFNLLQGIFAYLATINLWLGIPLNFLAMFLVGFFFSYNLQKPFFIGFGLQYLFMLTVPVEVSELPLRLMALATGAIVVMFVQLLFNKNKLSKKGIGLLNSICEGIEKKIDSITDSENTDETNQIISSSIKQLRKIIYEKRENKFYLTNEGRILLKISGSLETISNMIDSSEMSNTSEMTMQKLKELLFASKNGLINDEGIDEALQKSLEGKETYQSENLFFYELFSTFEILFIQLKQKNAIGAEHLNKREKIGDIPHTFRSYFIYISNFKAKSITFSYAFRLGIVIAVTAFIVDYFQLSQGKWLIFTVFSVTQPYVEHANFRSVERFIGTIIGIVIFMVSFSIFKDPAVRSIVILIAGYLNSYAVHYRYIVITVTVSALGSAALIGDANILTWERFIYVASGIVIAMIANKLIMPQKLEDKTDDFIQMYKDTSRRMLKQIYEYLQHPNNSHSINSLFAVSSLFEDRILMNNEMLSKKENEEFIKEQRVLHNQIYEFFIRIQHNKLQENIIRMILNDLKMIMKQSPNDFDKMTEVMYKQLQDVTTPDEKIILNDLIVIVDGLKKNFLTSVNKDIIAA